MQTIHTLIYSPYAIIARCKQIEIVLMKSHCMTESRLKIMQIRHGLILLAQSDNNI